MKIITRGKGYKAKPTKVHCEECKSKLEVDRGEWKKGEYASEMVVACPVCGSEIVEPGTEYQGDF